MKKIEFVQKELNFEVSEAYKALRTNLLFCGDDIKVVLVTSCVPNDGKSTTSLNLAKTLADNDKKILFIDADLRKSVFISKVNMEEVTYGLSHFLSGQVEISNIIIPTEKPTLDVIFTGFCPPNPAELLGNNRFKELIEKVRTTYDYIIIDTPPIGTVTDGAVIAPVCDGIILVIAENKISYKFAQRVKLQLERTNCRILGAVLNGVKVKKDNLYYNKYYDEYSSSKERKKK